MKVLDMHCDTISVLLEQKRMGREISLRKNEGHLDLLRMQKSGYLLQNLALFVDSGSGNDPWEEVCALHALYAEEMAKNEAFRNAHCGRGCSVQGRCGKA